jgi:hypothetical protein
MTIHRAIRNLIGATLAGAFAVSLATPALAGAPLTEADAMNLAVDAYLYFYPAVTIDVTWRQLIYGPMQSALTGEWNPPAITKQ